MTVDTTPDPALDALTTLAADLCQTPIAVVCLVDGEVGASDLIPVAHHGPALSDLPGSTSLCAHIVTSGDALLVPDIRGDDRFAHNPLVTGSDGIRFYAGAPILAGDGRILGTLCVLDTVPRTLDALQQRALRVLATQVTTALSLREASRERRRLQEQLAQQNRELNDAQAVARVGSWATDLRTLDVRWSEQTHRIFGTDPATFEVTHPRFMERVHPDDRGAVNSAFVASASQPGPWRIEHRIVLDSGEERLVEEQWRVFADAEGRPDRAVGTCHDITEQRRAEQKVARLNRVYALLSRIGDAIVHATDRQTLLEQVCAIAVSVGGLRAAWVAMVDEQSADVHRMAAAGVAPAFLEAIGVQSERMQPAGPLARMLASNRTAVHNDLANDPTYPWSARALEHGLRSKAALPLRHDGRTTGALMVYAETPGFFDAEEIALLEELATNVSFAVHHLNSEAQRRQAQEERDRIFTLSSDMLATANIHGYLVQLNPSWERVLGWTVQELTARPWMEFVHPDDRDVTERAGRLLGNGHEITDFENRYVTKHGEYRWLSWAAHPAVEDGLIFAVARDVTERRLRDEQQFRSQRLESIGTLAGGIAHDLNNVLTPIVFSLDMLRESLPDAELAPVLDGMTRSARRGAEMVRQLLLFARGSTVARRPMALESVIGDVMATVHEVFPRGITLETHLEAELPWVLGDATQLQQVFLNLCLNSRDAMPNGGTLRITARAIELDAQAASLHGEVSPGAYVLAEITDTGVGMSREVLSRMFDPFFTTKEPGRGTGLGLSTSRSIVQGHGGFIHAYSEEQRGTRFVIGLPAVARGDVPVVTPERRAPRGRGQMVLLVDDEAPIREVGQALLQAYGYRVTVAAHGAEALHLLQQDAARFDVMVTDIMMPVMDGVALIQAARLLRPTLPIIASSGLEDEERRRAVDAAGVHDFLAKPYSSEIMLAALHRLLSGAGAESISP